MKKIVIIILLAGVFIGLLGYYYWQSNSYSKRILKLEILGPEEASAFEEVEYLVKYKNNGNTILEEPTLTFQYPENALPINEAANRVIKNLDDIYPGEEKTISFKAQLIGKESETKKAEAFIRFKPRNLKAFYETETTFTLRIKSLPLTFEIDLPSKLEPNKETDFYLNYFSNASLPISDLSIKIEYPSGFEFISSQPVALDKAEWDVPLLNKAEGGRIEIKGKISGEAREQKVFKATLGIWQRGNFILLKEAVKGVEMLESSISVSQLINGSSEYTAFPGDLLHYEIIFRNTGKDAFQNLFLALKLEGKAFDFDTLRADLGQFSRGDNSIIWDYQKIAKLGFLGQGEEGKVEFWINLKNQWEIASPQEKNAAIKSTIIISQARDEFETKVNSKLEISQKGYFQEAIFGNSGPLPPQLGEPTTYTITWQAKNYYNDAIDVKVKANLPQGIKLTGKILPEGAPLTYDSLSRELVWQIGDLQAGQGVLNSGPTISFQVALTPEIPQKGQTPLIIAPATITGQDTWTGNSLTATANSINTTLPDDDTVNDAMGIVQ